MSQRKRKLPHKKISIRSLKWAFYRRICSVFPFLRQKICFFEKSINIDQITTPLQQRHVKIDLKDKALALSPKEKDFIARGWMKEAEIITDIIERQEDIYLVKKASVLGHTGAVIYNDKVIQSSSNQADYVHHNQCKPLFRCERLKGDATTLYFSMLGLHAGHKHFYHYFIDYLAELYSVLTAFPNHAALKKHDFEKLVIFVRDDLASYQKQAYEYIATNYPHITFETLESKQVIDIENLLFLDVRQNVFSSYLDESYIHFLKSVFAANIKHPKNPSDLSGRYYISRKDVKNRHISNEQEIIDYLKPLGFEILLPARLSLEKQIEIFANAECIICGAGAALTNLIYCHPETKAIILYAENVVGSQYLWLSKAVGIENIQHLLTPPTEEKREHFEIPVELINQALKRSGIRI